MSVRQASPTFDGYTGDVLPEKLVTAAKMEEVQAMESVWDVWGVVPVDEAWKVAGRRPIGGKWVCSNKGDRENPDVRARWCAKEVATYKSDAFFAAAPPPSRPCASSCPRRPRKDGGGAGS